MTKIEKREKILLNYKKYKISIYYTPHYAEKGRKIYFDETETELCCTTDKIISFSMQSILFRKFPCTVLIFNYNLRPC